MSTRTPTASSGRLTLLAVALLVSAPALFVEVGPLGALVAVVSVGAAVATTGVLGVATLHLGAVALLSASPPTVVTLVLLETASTFLLGADVPPGRRLETGALFVPVAVVLSVVVATVAERNGLPTAALALVVAVALGTYVLHRYARLRLGLAAGELDT